MTASCAGRNETQQARALRSVRAADIAAGTDGIIDQHAIAYYDALLN